MSSHYIYIGCSTPECKSFESIYTGDLETYEFDDADWEGEVIRVKCKLCKGASND